MKKDIALSILYSLIWSLLLYYVVFLWYYHIDIIPSKTRNYDITIMCIIWAISITIIFIWIFKICLKKPRLTQILLWIFLILFPYYVWITDYPTNTQHVYLKDILVIIWTLSIVLWSTKLCIYNKCIKKEEEQEKADMEIIEV